MRLIFWWRGHPEIRPGSFENIPYSPSKGSISLDVPMVGLVEILGAIGWTTGPASRGSEEEDPRPSERVPSKAYSLSRGESDNLRLFAEGQISNGKGRE